MSREIGQSRWYPWLINGALLVLALVSLAPLLWMLSVSFLSLIHISEPTRRS